MRARLADPIAQTLQAQLLPFAMRVLYLVLVSSAIYISRSHWAYDDPFITYRYAHNLAQGAGFVYNPTERILSTTTPLFTLLLAFIFPLWSNLPQAAVLIGSISLAGGGLSLWELGKAWKAPPVGWVGLGLYPTFPLLLDTLGSEMPFYLALCLAAIASFANKRYLLCAIFSALATLTRPDGILLAFILSIVFITQIRPSQSITQLLHRPALLFIAITLPWLLFAWFYFGSPIPATLATKQHQASMEISTGFIAGSVNLARRYTSNENLIRQGYILLEALLAVIGILAALLWRCFFLSSKQLSSIERRTISHPWLPILIWPMLYFLAYTALDVSGYFWYYAPLALGFLIASGLGIFTLQHCISALISCSNRMGDFNTATEQSKNSSVSVLVFATTLLICTALVFCQALSLPSDRQKSDPRYLIYRAIGEWIHENTSPEAYTGALEVGIIGYFAQRPMIDFAGLLQPAVALQLKPGNTYQDAAQWAIENYRPEFIVLHRNVFPLVEQLVIQRCVLVQQFSGAAYNYTGDLDIYHCLKP